MADLRKRIELPLLDDTVELDVTFEIIEVVERVYDMRAEYVAAQLSRPVKILRKDLANVAVGWMLGRTERSRREIREYVMTADGDTLNLYIGAIQAAILYSLREITDEEFERLSKGQDLDDAPGDGSKKKPGNGSSIAPTEPQ